MTLRKDKDIESKKGGLDALFRDGIPLNENFLALKNRYKKERKELEEQISILEKEISSINNSNVETEKRLDIIQGEYRELSKQDTIATNTNQGKERE